ncbi:MAG: hypothetical protein KDA46_01580 [Parvularculaceae bacterium]|nr:hypothetical protein [Parvularculaceae bacterium]
MPSVYIKGDGATSGKANTDQNSVARKLSIIAIYTFLGPPVGGALTAISMFFLEAFDASNGSLAVFATKALQSLPGMVFIIPSAAIYGYFFGGVQAFITGVGIAYAANGRGGFGYLTAILVPLVVGVVAGVLIATDFRLDFTFRFDFTRLSSSEYVSAAVLAVIGVGASLVLRFLFRRRFAPVHNL